MSTISDVDCSSYVIGRILFRHQVTVVKAEFEPGAMI